MKQLHLPRIPHPSGIGGTECQDDDARDERHIDAEGGYDDRQQDQAQAAADTTDKNKH
jgi:hypothetical protein